MNMTTVYLEGGLRDLLGEQTQLRAGSFIELIRGLDVQAGGEFRKFLMDQHMKGVTFAIWVDGKNVKEGALTNLEGFEEVRIVPIAEGAKDSWISVVLGVVLIAVAWWNPGSWGWVGTSITSSAQMTWGGLLGGLGVGLAMQGVGMMLMDTPELGGLEGDRGSAFLDGTRNTHRQGAPLPVVLGGPVFCGSARVSRGSENVDIRAYSADYGSGYDRQDERDELRSKTMLRTIDIISHGRIRGLCDQNGNLVSDMSSDDRFKCMYFDDTPVRGQDGTYHYQGVYYNQDFGRMDDPGGYVAGFFMAEATPVSVTASMTQNNPVTRTVTLGANQGLRYTVQIDSLFVMTDPGKSSERGPQKVTWKVEWRANGSSDPWTEPTADYASPISKSGKTMGQSRWTYEVDPGVGTWDVRLTKTTADSADPNEEGGDMSWYEYSVVTRGSSAYAGFASARTRIDASLINRIPNMSWKAFGVEVRVPDIYDGVNRTYSTGVWDGTFKGEDLTLTATVADGATSISVSATTGTFTSGDEIDFVQDGRTYTTRVKNDVSASATSINIEAIKTGGVTIQTSASVFGYRLQWTNNPAWLLYYIIQNNVWGARKLAPSIFGDKFAIFSIGEWCDEQVPDGNSGTGTEHRFSMGMQIGTEKDALTWMKNIASTFYGQLMWFQGGFLPVADRSGTPIHLFNQANVKDGNFNWSTTSVGEKPTVYHVGWNDQNDYNRLKFETVTTDEFDTELIPKLGWKPQRVSPPGVMSQGQARRHGLNLLYTAHSQPDICTFVTGVEGAGLLLGDIVDVADPGLYAQRIAGRISSIQLNATNIQVTLDESIVLSTESTGDYHQIKMLKTDGTYVNRTLAGVTAGATTNVEFVPVGGEVVADFVAEIPWIIEAFIGSAETEAVPMIVINKRQHSDLHEFEVSCLTYNPSKFSAIESGLSIEPPPIEQVDPGTPAQPTNVQLDFLRVGGGNALELHVSWDAVYGQVEKYGWIMQSPNENFGSEISQGLSKFNTVTMPFAGVGTYTFSVWAQSAIDGRHGKSAVGTLTVTVNDIISLSYAFTTGGDPVLVSDETALLVDNGVLYSRIRVDWTLTGDERLDDQSKMEIRYRKSTTGDTEAWIKLPLVDTDADVAYISDVEDGTDYDVEYRISTRYGAGSWVNIANDHTVVGKTSLPADMTTNGTGTGVAAVGGGLEFNWDETPDDDVRVGGAAGFWLLTSPGTPTGKAHGFCAGAQTRYVFENLTPGQVYYVYGKFQDSTKNVSANFHLLGNATVLSTTGDTGPVGPSGSDGLTGPDGDDGLTAISNAFDPGLVGGSSDASVWINRSTGGSSNPGEIRVQGTIFNHPDGTQRTINNSDIAIYTDFETVSSGGTGKLYLAWTDTAPHTRFGGVAGDWGINNDHFVMLQYDSGAWKARNNAGTLFAFPGGDPLASTDAIFGVIERPDQTSAGIQRFASYLWAIPPDKFANGFVYYQTIQSGNPGTPTATSYSFSTGLFTGLTAGWDEEQPTVEITDFANWEWRSAYSVQEDGFTGVQTITFQTSAGAAQVAANIESDLFTAGSAGWRIERTSGNAEFNNIKVRGSIYKNKTGVNDSADGFYLGEDGGSYGFNFGDVDDYIKWTGTYLDVLIKSGSGKIVIEDATTTNARMEFKPGVYDFTSVDTDSIGDPYAKIRNRINKSGTTYEADFSTSVTDDGNDFASVNIHSAINTAGSASASITIQEGSHLDSIEIRPSTGIGYKTTSGNWLIRLHDDTYGGKWVVLNNSNSTRVEAYVDSNDHGRITLHDGAGGETIFRHYDSSETDITGIITGSTFGSLIEARGSGHFVIGLRGDTDSSDSFAILKDISSNGTYDERLFHINSDDAFFETDVRLKAHALRITNASNTTKASMDESSNSGRVLLYNSSGTNTILLHANSASIIDNSLGLRIGNSNLAAMKSVDPFTIVPAAFTTSQVTQTFDVAHHLSARPDVAFINCTQSGHVCGYDYDNSTSTNCRFWVRNNADTAWTGTRRFSILIIDV